MAALVSMWRMRRAGIVLRAILAHRADADCGCTRRGGSLTRASTRGSDGRSGRRHQVTSFMPRAPFAARRRCLDQHPRTQPNHADRRSPAPPRRRICRLRSAARRRSAAGGGASVAAAHASRSPRPPRLHRPPQHRDPAPASRRPSAVTGVAARRPAAMAWSALISSSCRARSSYSPWRLDQDVALAAGPTALTDTHAISTGANPYAGRHARLPPIVATLRTRTLEWVSKVSAMTGAAWRTAGERSNSASRTIAPIMRPPSGVSSIAVSDDPSARRLTRRCGW